jgi:two-component system, OmpR family, response regulator ChvI
MIVDDEPDITLSIEQSLKETGLFDVFKFNNSLEVLSNFKSGMYDLLIFDVRMPEMDGFELLREVRKVDDKVRICFLTALSELKEYDSSIIQVCPTLNEDYIIRKPIDNRELVRRITHILSSDRVS